MRDILLNLILPPFGLLILAAIVSVWASRGRARWWLGAFWLGVVMVSTPIVAEALLRLPLQLQPRFSAVTPPPTPLAVVVPTGGASVLSGGVAWPQPGSTARAQHGYTLARMLNVPFVLSGGILGDLPESEARITARALGFMPGSVLLEEQSRDTCENAEQSAALLRPMGITTVVAVTDAAHLPRFMACLRRHGLQPVAEEPGWARVGRGPALSVWLPGNGGLATLASGAHAHVGLAWYLLTGRIGLQDLWPDEG